MNKPNVCSVAYSIHVVLCFSALRTSNLRPKRVVQNGEEVDHNHDADCESIFVTFEAINASILVFQYFRHMGRVTLIPI